MESRILDFNEDFVNGSIDFSLDSLRITGQGDPAVVPEAGTLVVWSALAISALVAQWWQSRRPA